MLLDAVVRVLAARVYNVRDNGSSSKRLMTG